MNVVANIMLWALVALLVGVGIYSEYSTHAVLNENPECVIERLQREVVDAEGRVDIRDIYRECK